MPYISTEKVAAKRAALKKAFPNVVFSVTRRHSSTIVVNIMKSDMDLGSKNEQINEYHIERFYEGVKKDFLLQVLAIINTDHEIGVYEDSDYGYVPNYYIDIEIGKWDKPYICTAVTQAT